MKELKPQNSWKKIEAVCFLTLVLAIIFLALSPQARGRKAKANRWNYVKLKSLYIAEETIGQTKILLTEWEKRLANNIAVRG